MANGYYERGEIYQIRMDSGFGSEQGYFRPGLIVSNNHGNETSSTINVAFLTTKVKPIGINIEVGATGRQSWVLCNQIATVDKARISNYMGVLNSYEQAAVDEALEQVFDLGYIDNKAVKEKEAEIADRDVLIGDLRNEVAGVKSEIGKKDEEIASLKMEIEMWQKCYGRCMDMLVDTKVNGDLQRRTAVEPVVVVEAPAAQPVEEPVEESPVEPVEVERLDINHCTATALKKIGFSLAVARKIVEGRPYKRVEDLKGVNGVKGTLFKILEPKLCCKPVIVSALVEEDQGYEADETVATEVPVKVNVNTASAQEIHDVTGLSITACFAITGKRKREGLFKSLDELIIPGRLSENVLRNYRDKMRV